MGPVLKQSWVHAELLKFIRIGLLCVQDRRLSRQAHHVFCASGSVPLPQPTQPAVSVGRIVARPGQFSPGAEICSVNDVTLSSLSPR
ncbi:hypothetical protein CUMW_010280 [Citrus unshiu]|nr:hypothetical protein CUMW_010280 [Citrus unshiu]